MSFISFFKDDITELLATPIKTDLGEVRGVFIVAVNKKNEVVLKGLKRLEFVEKFVNEHETFWSSQSEDLRSSLAKICLTHFQILSVMAYVVLPWSGNTSSMFSHSKQTASAFTTFTIGNKCLSASLCGDIEWIYCKSLLTFCFPFVVVFTYFLVQMTRYLYFKYCKPTINLNKLLKQIKVQIMLMSIVILYNMYTVLTQTVYALNSCRELGSHGWHMEFEFNTKCYSKIQRAWNLSLSIPGWILFIIGIPALLIKVLYKNRNTIGMFETRRYLGALYNGYRLEFFY